MALYRTALRLATLEALRPTAVLASDGPWPTLAGKYVFDSRLDPIEDLTKDQHKAVIVVYTEMDEGHAGQYRGGPPFRRVVDLVFEISQIASAPSDADPAAYVAGIPQTDAELEAEIDRIETEIYLALLYGPSGSIWRRLTGRMVTDPRSAVHRTSEEGARLAWRTVTWKVQCPDDLFEAAPQAPLVGLDRLPKPLKEVVERLGATAYGASLGAGLAATMPTMPLATPLEDITIGVELVRGGFKQTGTANVGGDVSWTVAAAVASPDNVGNGTVTLGSRAYTQGVQVGIYTALAISPVQWRIYDPNGDVIGFTMDAVAFVNQIIFTVNHGSTAFVPGDSFTFTVS